MSQLSKWSIPAEGLWIGVIVVIIIGAIIGYLFGMKPPQ
jgi:hypothetical protein